MVQSGLPGCFVDRNREMVSLGVCDGAFFWLRMDLATRLPGRRQLHT